MGLDELHSAFARGELVSGTAAGTIAFAKTMLRTFLESLAADDLDESLRWSASADLVRRRDRSGGRATTAA